MNVFVLTRHGVNGVELTAIFQDSGCAMQCAERHSPSIEWEYEAHQYDDYGDYDLTITGRTTMGFRWEIEKWVVIGGEPT